MFTIHCRGQFLVVLITAPPPHIKDFMMRKDKQMKNYELKIEQYFVWIRANK